ncbi:MAG: AsmA family protein [Desulfuromonadales bacterium]|nr:AsmA family protein [Desulfuromonadales bacterium]
MQRWKKILLLLTALIGVGFVVVLVLVNILITPDRVRNTLVPMVAERLHRDLQLGEIEISLLSGIVLNDVVLTNREADNPFVAVEKAVLRYRLLPLFMLRVEVAELRLVRPHLQITRYSDGTFNFTDLTQTADSAVAKKPEKTTDSAPPPLAVYVSEIVITEGDIQFIDQTKKGERHTVSDLNLAVNGFSLTEPFQLTLSGDWNANAFALNGKFNLDDFSADFDARINQTRIDIKGGLLAEARGERLRATIRLPAASVSSLLGSIPPGLVAIPEKLKLDGKISAQIVLDGLTAQPETLLHSGQIEFDQITAHIDAIQADLNGTVLLEQNRLKTGKLVLKLNGQPLDISAQMTNLLQRPLQGDFSIQSARIDLDRLFPANEVGNETAAKPEVKTESAQIGPFSLPLAVTGTVRINELLYRQLPLQNVAAELSLKENVLTLNRLTADVAEGTVDLSALVNLGEAGLLYQSQMEFKSVQINPIVKVFAPDLAESLFALLNGQLSLDGAGTDEPSLKQNTSGIGSFNFNQGTLTRMPILDSASNLLGLEELKNININEGDVTFKINKGVVELGLQTSGRQLKQNTSGNVSLEGVLGLKTNLALSPELSQKLDRKKVLGDLLTDSAGWTHIPIRVKGDYSSPKVTLDTTAMSQQAKQKGVDILSEKLKKELNRGKADSGNAEEDPAEQLIDKALKGLFGK